MRAKTFIPIMAVVAIMSACSSDGPQFTGPVEANFSANINGKQTRASGTTWDASDAIGITGTSNGTTYSNYKYTVSGAGATSFTGNPIYFQDNKNIPFTAYYPFSGTDGTALSLVTLSPQTSATAERTLKNIDFLYGTGTGSYSSSNVSLGFTHKMSQIVLTFSADADVDLKNMTKYALGSVILDGSFDTSTGACAATTTGTPTTGLPMTVTPSSSSSYTSTVILYPQTISVIPISVTLDGETYSANLAIPASGTALASGSSYSYTITVHKASITGATGNITDWTSVTGTGVTVAM
jgi:hypothetical protein